MRLKSVRIRHFKRFVNLSINRLPAEARLVVLLGPNGCGKSSLFDAFQKHLKVERLFGLNDELLRYYRRKTPEDVLQEDDVSLEFHNRNPSSEDEIKRSLYIRSAYRHDPSFQNTAIQQQNDVLDRHSVRRLIDTDQTVQNNYQRIIWRLLREATTPGLSTDKIMANTIGDLQQSMRTVFEDIHLDALVSLEEKGTFTFTKQGSRNFLYEHLSAGEKAAFDLLLDIVINKSSYNDSLYCIDEPEAHLSTKLQAKLLREIYRLVPENSQLWLATHSIGMVREAQEILIEHPEQVIFLDFGFHPDGSTRDFNQIQEIEPAEPNHEFWSRHYAVALEDMAGLLAPDRIVLCEGNTDDESEGFDASCYNKIFAREFPRTRFFSVGSATAVEKRMGELIPLLERIVHGAEIVRFRDRDDLTLEEVETKRLQSIRVLSSYRNIESMLLSDGVLSRLCESAGKSDQFNEICAIRDKVLENVEGHYAADDLKPAAQAVHHAAKTRLEIDRPGESKVAFMRDVLAPLITADMPEYQKLKCDIFSTSC